MYTSIIYNVHTLVSKFTQLEAHDDRTLHVHTYNMYKICCFTFVVLYVRTCSSHKIISKSDQICKLLIKDISFEKSHCLMKWSKGWSFN